MDNFDTERFIEEIENRPPLWDSTLEEYSKRELKKQCWDDIVDIFGGKSLTATERRNAEITLQKKWKGIRGCFTRELKRQEKLKAGDFPGPRKSEYTHFQQLQFLRKVVISRDSDEAPDYIYYEVPDFTTNIKKEDDDDDPLQEDRYRRAKKPKYELDDDEDKLFLLSMLSTLQSIPVSKKITTKIKLLTVLEEATRNEDD
ncbi:uncharacterized protein LOC124535193 [Vanessa cardui]|uniref:uncharacterized protein LOC124535193 n=1 Tax=Vanessa cardui TaxID=171605 RepID=UPI001F1344F0|nr:uncharacterized protein LOC124535193 [Vanessa cardui]